MTTIGPITVHEFLFFVNAGVPIPEPLRDAVGMDESQLEASVAAGAFFAGVRTRGGAEIAAIGELQSVVDSLADTVATCETIFRLGANATSGDSCRIIMGGSALTWELVVEAGGLCYLSDSTNGEIPAVRAWLDQHRDGTCLVTAYSRGKISSFGTAHGVQAIWNPASGWHQTDSDPLQFLEEPSNRSN